MICSSGRGLLRVSFAAPCQIPKRSLCDGDHVRAFLLYRLYHRPNLRLLISGCAGSILAQKTRSPVGPADDPQRPSYELRSPRSPKRPRGLIRAVSALWGRADSHRSVSFGLLSSMGHRSSVHVGNVVCDRVNFVDCLDLGRIMNFCLDLDGKIERQACYANGCGRLSAVSSPKTSTMSSEIR